MNEMQSTANRNRKILTFAALLVIFVILPGISWFYLKGGLQWRRDAQAELGVYGKIRSVPVVWPDGQKEDQAGGKVCVVYLFGAEPDATPINKRVLDVCEKLSQQFGDNPAFRLVMVSEGGTSEFKSYYQKLPSADKDVWLWHGALSSWTTILANGYEQYCVARRVDPYPAPIALADADGTIRRFYNTEKDKEMGRLVEHIAILLPK